MAVWPRAHDQLSGNIGACARPVFDDEWLTKALRQPLTDDACVDVGRSPCDGANDQMHRSRWIGLCPCDPWQRRERGSTRG